MNEGWYGREYFVVYSEREVGENSEKYGITDMLPGFQIIGLLGWDDFIVRDPFGNVFKVPTVPCSPRHLERYRAPTTGGELVADAHYTRRIKWYLKPIAFGGDPTLGENITWVTLNEHAELVRWWNRRYRDLAGR